MSKYTIERIDDIEVQVVEGIAVAAEFYGPDALKNARLFVAAARMVDDNDLCGQTLRALMGINAEQKP